MISALLMIVAVATPTPPSVSATATPTTCGQAAITITTDQTVELEFGGVLIGRPAAIVPGGGSITLSWTAPPGTPSDWSVEDFRSDLVFASGTFTMPACLSAPERPTIVYADEPDVPEVGSSVMVTRTRWAFWNWTLRRFGGAW